MVLHSAARKFYWTRMLTPQRPTTALQRPRLSSPAFSFAPVATLSTDALREVPSTPTSSLSDLVVRNKNIQWTSELEAALLQGMIDAFDRGFVRREGVSDAGWNIAIERILGAVDDDDQRDALRGRIYKDKVQKKAGSLRRDWRKLSYICRQSGVTADAQGRVSETAFPSLSAYFQSPEKARYFMSKPFTHGPLCEELWNRRLNRPKSSGKGDYSWNTKVKALGQLDKQFAYLADEDRIAVAVQMQKERLCFPFLRVDKRLQEDFVRYLLRTAGRDDSVVKVDRVDVKIEGSSR